MEELMATLNKALRLLDEMAALLDRLVDTTSEP